MRSDEDLAGRGGSVFARRLLAVDGVSREGFVGGRLRAQLDSGQIGILPIGERVRGAFFRFQPASLLFFLFFTTRQFFLALREWSSGYGHGWDPRVGDVTARGTNTTD